jgi:predicted DNA-binding transcriptional regulator YafY
MVYRPTARVLTVLELLQARGRMTGAALAERLEVDIRTVRSYVETLQDLGIPVEAERGRYGGYRLRPGFKLPPLIFTEDEALALTIGLLMAQQAGPAATAPSVAGALAKVERVLPEATRARVRAVEQTVVFAGGPPRAVPSTAAVAVLSAAVQDGRRVRLRYRSARAQETERAFDPFGVVSQMGTWYTIGHCHLRRGERLFRLDRILHVEPLAEAFPRPTGFDALAAVERALAAVPRPWQVEVWLGMTAAEAGERTGLSAAHFEETGGGVLLRTGADDLETMARYLAWLGAPLVVHEPPELRAVLRRYALALARDADRAGA